MDADKREELVAKAGGAFWEAIFGGLEGESVPDDVMSGIRAALAVFEQAHTPRVIERPDFVMPDPDSPSECLDCGRTDGGCDRIATGLKPHTAYTVRANGGEPVTLTTSGDPTDDEREALLDSERLRQLAESQGMDCGNEEVAHRLNRIADRLDRLATRRTVQGEPTDAQAATYEQAAAVARSYSSRPGDIAAHIASILSERAAAATQEGENR